jgi:redox-sensitive bicupin YhaK (pirin superfamily)
LVGSRDGRDGSITIHQDIDLYATLLQNGEAVSHRFATGRVAWVQVARGSVQLNEQTLTAGDGAAIVEEAEITLRGNSDDAEVLLFEMAA